MSSHWEVHEENKKLRHELAELKALHIDLGTQHMKLEGRLYDEYERRLLDMHDFFVTKIDAFLTKRTLGQCKELGGEKILNAVRNGVV